MYPIVFLVYLSYLYFTSVVKIGGGKDCAVYLMELMEMGVEQCYLVVL